MKPVAVNRKAHFNYFLFDRFEAGISLQGCEVKSIREGRINLAESFVHTVGKELYLFNCHISPYSKIQGHLEVDPIRRRKLLLNRAEIDRLIGMISRKGHACVPLAVYFKDGRAKVEIAVAQGKKRADKRETLKRRIHEREAAAEVKRRSRRK